MRSVDLSGRRSRRLRVELGLLDVSEIAAELGVSEEMARSCIRFGDLEGEVRVFGGLRVYFAHRDAVRAFKRRYARSVSEGDRSGTARRAWLDEDAVVGRFKSLGWLQEHARRHRLSEDQAELLVRAKVRERRARILRHARGRKPSTGPAAHHVEWAREFAATKAEFERDFELGARGKPPTDWEVALDVAERDWRARPVLWKGYSADPDDPTRLARAFRENAANRILRATKALQKDRTENSAT
jgi:hypothetical protein